MLNLMTEMATEAIYEDLELAIDWKHDRSFIRLSWRSRMVIAASIVTRNLLSIERSFSSLVWIMPGKDAIRYALSTRSGIAIGNLASEPSKPTLDPTPCGGIAAMRLQHGYPGFVRDRPQNQPKR